MGRSRAETAVSHQRIVDLAVQRFRERGRDGVSIAGNIIEAGPTMGGFYKHFAARDVGRLHSGSPVDWAETAIF